MTLPFFADLTALVAAAVAWRVSKPVGAAIALSVLASFVHAKTGVEALRWSSALVGLVGAVELGRRAKRRATVTVAHQHAATWVTESGLRGAEVWRDLMARGVRRNRAGRPEVLGVLCLTSMADDGTAYLAWEHLAEWVQPAAQLVMSGLVIAVCVWPRRRT